VALDAGLAGWRGAIRSSAAGASAMTLAELIPSLRSSLPHPLEPWLWPASTHHVPGGDLSVGGPSLVGVAAEHGTPANVLDLAEFRARCATYRSAFDGADVAYAGKALLTRAVARIIDDEGLSLDVCSAGEPALARDVRFPADRVILHGNAKPASLLSRAMALGVGRIVVDSLDEVALLASVALAPRAAARSVAGHPRRGRAHPPGDHHGHRRPEVRFVDRLRRSGRSGAARAVHALSRTRRRALPRRLAGHPHRAL
jgi:hypothetical protein